MPEKTKILIVDDHAIFRHGLRDIIERNFPAVIVGEAETGPEAVERVRKTDWDVMVLDMTMPGQSGLDVLQEVRQLKPGLRVLVLSMHREEQYALRVLKAGAAGYVTKIKAPQAIIEAIKRVSAGEKYLSPALEVRIKTQAKSGAEKLPHEQLSRREYQVMCMLPLGKSLKAIASDLAVSVQTVSTHRARILKKMGLRSNAELIRYALNNDLVE